MKSTARLCAIECLTRLQKQKTPVKHILGTLFRKMALAEKDRNLTVQIVYGILRWKQSLDSILEELCTQPLKKMKPEVYHALLVGMYQLVFLERIPESAAVNESVNALKALRTPKRLVGFTNGVLRNYLRKRSTFPRPSPPEKSQDLLNHPAWLTKRWEKAYGEKQMIDICAANTQEPMLTLRVNLGVVSRNSFMTTLAQEGIDAVEGRYAPAAVLLPGFHGTIEKIPGYHQGFFSVQDQAAQLASLLLGPFGSERRYLDGCAGLGGKTLHLAEMIQQQQDQNKSNTEPLVALEPDQSRFIKLRENISRKNPTPGIATHQMTLADYAATKPPMFDNILLDAPCSGTGVTGRHPDIRWNRSENDLERYSREQQRLLGQATRLLKPGGILVYCTCSIEHEENGKVIEHFLKQHPSFSVERFDQWFPDQAKSLCRGDYFSPLPSGEIDGFFGAKLKKNG